MEGPITEAASRSLQFAYDLVVSCLRFIKVPFANLSERMFLREYLSCLVIRFPCL